MYLTRIAALLIFFFLFPILIFLGILIIIDDGLPILFKQKRIGVKNSHFWIYKLRTMKNKTPNVSSDKLDKNLTIFTKTGPILRKLSIDELPQLINVIKGEMSFIGPRPALYNQYDLIEKRTKAGVSELVPGITGWAQINGRDNLSNKEKVKMEAFYLKNRSMLLNFKILFLTLFKVIKKEGVSH
jgi:O-antigen biosynthesis protein WbqP